ncbi:hypothetical protein KY290_036818 [Solanum tuberosum]|uniref:RNase H type-1 domain-containing protein n=1 Tax=Solanum tuberosum TaxID=4113 RepID=A0ABQ7TVB1_SOLTU|nr:hypothetical protein KY289_036295 [Solanum tuberosum]KAH0639553.1 hypothetical protein KY285_036139 [Solanum tuberosum]KAH0738113.1 hypothetical protein KY290_036818 [Solanum tuberosum]
MVEYAKDNIIPPNREDQNDKAWWMGSTQGDFTVKSAWQIVRKKKEITTDFDFIWNKGLPFKVNFFLWRVWKRRVPTDDNLKRMKLQLVSRCWCCEKKKEETMTHLFLTASIANRLWKQFAGFAGIHMDGMHLEQLIIAWWTQKTSPQLQGVMRAMPAIIMWTLWKGRNNLKHGGSLTFNGVVMQVQDMVKKLVKRLYPWIYLESTQWSYITRRLRRYKPTLHYHSVVWRPPDLQKLKCNVDGASKGNPGPSSYGFCQRNSQGDLIYARAAGVGNTTNFEAESLAIYESFEYCWEKQLREVIIETDSLTLVKMIRGQWKLPCELVEREERIRKRLQGLNATIIHTFRGANGVPDLLAKEVVESQNIKEYTAFVDLPTHLRRQINSDKAQIPTLRIRTRKINIQH